MQKISIVVDGQGKIFNPREDIENTSWKVLVYGIYARVVEVRVSEVK